MKREQFSQIVKEQLDWAVDGTPQCFRKPLANVFGVNVTTRPNLSITIWNELALSANGEPFFTPAEELTHFQQGFDLAKISDKRNIAKQRNIIDREPDPEYRKAQHDLLDSELEKAAWFQNLFLLEFKTQLNIAYGSVDFVTPAEALERDELKFIGPEIHGWIERGKMDVLIPKDRTRNQFHRMEPACYKVIDLNLFNLRRLLIRNQMEPTYWFCRKDRRGEAGSEFGRLTGHLVKQDRDPIAAPSTLTQYVLYGRAPSEGCDIYPLDKKAKVLESGHGRGYVIILPAEYVELAIATAQLHSLPRFDTTPPTPSIFRLELSNNPVPEACYNRLMEWANRLEAEKPVPLLPAHQETETSDEEPQPEVSDAIMELAVAL